MEQSVLSTTMAASVRAPALSNSHDYAASMPKLSRGFSKVQANQSLMNETRSHIENNYKSLNDLNEMNYLNKFLNNELTCYSFMLPNLNRFEDYKFKEYLQNDLLEMPAQHNLTESGHLNWWTQNNWENVCRPLYPMITSGDGNCLLHSASLAMWGLHDRYLILRRALNTTLKQIKEDNSSPLWRRWKWEQMCQNRKYGLIYDENEWAKEWQSLLKLSSDQPRVAYQQTTSSSSKQLNSGSTTRYANNLDTQSHESSSSISSSSLKSTNMPNPNNAQDSGTCYFESLEEFHVFLLANILQRPIIIVSDTMLHDLNGEPLSPIPFGGIYLPFECELSKCHRYPLVLAYDSAHFSALVLMDEDEDMYENDQENYHENDPENILTNEEINQINKRLQLRPPYSMIPIQYSNKELLPVHFAYDPGEGYDWSKFPQRVIPGTNNNNSNSNKSATSQSSSNNSSNDNMSVSSNNNNNNNTQTNQKNSFSDQSVDQSIEISRSERMFLIQKYLDICKLEMFDTGPLSTKRNTQVFNSNGMCASIHNVRVPEPFVLNADDSKELKSKSTNKLGKFFSNLFKRGGGSGDVTKNNQNDTKSNKDDSIFSSKLRKSLRNSYSPSPRENKKSTLSSISTNPQYQASTSPGNTKTLPNNLKTVKSTPATLDHASKKQAAPPSTNTIFHKVQTHKNWNALFNTLDSNPNSFLGVKLNLVKMPKFKQVINNYIDSARYRLEVMKQQHKAQLLHQQQQKQYQILQQQQHQQQQYSNYQSKETYEQQQRLTPRYITTVNNEPRQMFNNNGHQVQQQQKHTPTVNVKQQSACPYNHKNCDSESLCQSCYASASRQNVSGMKTNQYSYNTNNNSNHINSAHRFTKNDRQQQFIHQDDEETIHHL